MHGTGRAPPAPGGARGGLAALALFGAVAAVASLAACKRDPALDRPDADGADDPAPPAPIAMPDAGAPLAPARCSAESVHLRLADAANGDVEVGEGVTSTRGYVLGLVRPTQKGRVGSVAIVSLDLSKVTWVDLGPAVGDAPPPLPVVRGDELFVAYHGRSAGRSLEVYRLASAVASRAFAITQPKDESLATDVVMGAAGPVVAWDETAREGGGGRGLVRAAVLGPLAADGGAPSQSAVTLSAKTADADGPRLARRPGGYWAVWTVHRAERSEGARDGGRATGATTAGVAARAYEAEGPAEDREYRWLEALALDDALKPTGTVRLLTPRTGHVEAFDLAPRSDGAAVDVLATDVTEARDGEGGRVWRITLRESSADAMFTVAERGVGHAAASLLAADNGASSLPWLAFVDPAEHTRLVPLGVARESIGLASVEPALEGARPAFAARRADGKTTLVSVYEDKTGAELRAATCAR